jgi:predicted RND superfamily exporter protein
MFSQHPKKVILFFAILSIIGPFLAINRINFSFDLEQFFPSGDDDLEFFLDFKKRFEPDDNFLLIGIKREEGVFEQKLMEDVLDLSLQARRIKLEIPELDTVNRFDYFIDEGKILIEPVSSSNSLLQIEYPIRNPITGLSSIPAVHLESPEKYPSDKGKILSDERLVNNFISEDAKTLVIVLKTINDLPQSYARKFIQNLNQLIQKYDFEEYHLLGRANFQTEIVRIQIREFGLSAFVSIIMVLLIMLLIFRRFWGVIVAMFSILVGLLIFVGILGLGARTLDSMALLYPIIMVIVATSDVVHVMSKYVDELQKGLSKLEAIKVTIKEIGMSILLTSTTTAVGFLSLMSSRLIPLQEFGINAAIGVMVAYVSVIIFTTTVLALFKQEQIIKIKSTTSFWTTCMEKVYTFTINYPRQIVVGFIGLFIVCGIGISLITTNSKIEKILPKGEQVTKDFQFFEKEFSGFRPLEIAVSLKGDYTTDDFKVIQELDKLEQHFRSYPQIRSTSSIAAIYKSINQAYYPAQKDNYQLPRTEKKFKKYKKFSKQLEKSNSFGVLISKDKKHTRISARILDIGADSIKNVINTSKKWIAENIDSDIMTTRATGTGVIIDKNSAYIRDSLLQGLLFAILVISLFMAFLYRNLKMIFIALIPNIIPLMIAGAILGFIQVPLEAGVAIVFAIIFGIAVDDTIHLLSKFKLCKDKGYDTEKAIHITLVETGKAICLTSVVLFFGFLILLFSSSPPAVTIGLLISSTLISALVCDLLIIPVMLRKWIP